MHVADLAGVGRGTTRSIGDAGAILDDRAKAEYRQRLADLEEERSDAAAHADPERAARAEEEIDFIARELGAAYGLGGRERRASDSAERVRKAVTNRIRDALAKIERVHPSLGRHLATSMRTGAFCSYDPEPRVAWQM